jgi:Fe-Mn family superoxide dismutase
MKYNLPDLNYGYDSLEPFFDKATMVIHHQKHHQAYTDKLNIVLDKYPQLSITPIEQLLTDVADLAMDENDKKQLINNGGGYVNHNLFWQTLGPQKEIDQELIGKIIKKFGTIDGFKQEFNKIALNHFASGWAWLVENQAGELEIYSLPNQESPLSRGHKPIFCLDLWEHAYYLKFQNLRVDYVQAWWSVLRLIN